MNNILLLILIFAASGVAHTQDSKDVIMEKRAREMHRVLCANDPAQWKKFIQENYSQALIDKPMRATVQSDDSGTTTNSETKSDNNLEEKTKIFQRLHDDFGHSKIISVKTTGDNLEMVLLDTGLKGTFKLKFDSEKPHLISGLGIEAGN